MSGIRHKIPTARQPFTVSDRAAQSWYRYLTGVEEIAIRLDGVDDTTGSETLGQLITKVQEILDAYKTE